MLKKRKAGRPTLLDDALISRAASIKALGTTEKDCYEALGISHSIWNSWKAQGKEDSRLHKDTIHAKFYDECLKAHALGKIQALQHIHRFAKSDWKAAAWFLERTDPENWGKHERLDMTLLKPVRIIDDLDDDENEEAE